MDVTKVATLVLIPTLTGLISGRIIFEGVLILHETIHELHRKKIDWFI
jgi:hypothetical protein